MVTCLGEISGGSTPSTKVPEYWEGNIPWLVPSEVTKSPGLYLHDTERHITGEGLRSCAARLLPAGTVMMTSRATIGEVAINAAPMATNQGFINVICKPERVHNEFLAHWIEQNKRVFQERAHGVTFKEITKSNFRTIPIALPPLAEQRAIAQTLRTIQGAVEARRREVALERERKAALMQHFFTYGTRGEVLKQTEIGEVPESWRVVRLGEVITLQRGFDLPQSDRHPGPIPVVSSSGITGRHAVAKVSGPGVVTGRYGTIGEVFFIEEDFWPLNTTLFVKEFNGNDPEFVAYFLGTLNMASLNDKTSVPGINRNHAHNMVVRVPPLPQQRTITCTLRACDATIAALERETAVLEELFRAMLEELMTGRLPALPLLEGTAEAQAAHAGGA